MKGQRRPLRVMSTSERVGWLCAKAARRSLALRAALDAGATQGPRRPPRVAHEAICGAAISLTVQEVDEVGE